MSIQTLGSWPAKMFGISKVKRMFALSGRLGLKKPIYTKNNVGQFSFQRSETLQIYTESDHELFHRITANLLKRQVKSTFVFKMYRRACPGPIKLMATAAVVYT